MFELKTLRYLIAVLAAVMIIPMAATAAPNANANAKANEKAKLNASKQAKFNRQEAAPKADVISSLHASKVIAQRIAASEDAQRAMGKNTLANLNLLPCGHFGDESYCPADMIGNGWRESFWNNTTFNGEPVLKRITAPPSYFWNLGSPAEGVNADNFAARWEGTFEAPTDETYRFQLRGTSQVRMFINGKLSCDMWRFTAGLRACGVNWSEYTGGKKVRIVIEYVHHAGDAQVHFLMGPLSESGFYQPVPINQAYSITHGVYHSGAPWDPMKIDEYTNLAGAKPGVMMWYQDWDHQGIREFDPVKMNDVTNRGMTPMLTWEPWNYEGGVEQPDYALSTIIAGNHDAYITDFAADAAAWGELMYLRPMSEMNGDWFSWSPGVNGNTSAEYVQAWRHIHDIFQAEGATNVKFVWSPNVVYNGSTPLTELYPGDSYVDWTGMDGYNWGQDPLFPGKTWDSLTDIFQPTYNEILTIAPNKPIMIAETASNETGGSKSNWITNGFGLTPNGLEENMERIRMVVWFNEDKETDWRINSSSNTLSSYQDNIALSPAYRGLIDGQYNTP